MSVAVNVDVWHVDLEESRWDDRAGTLAIYELALAQRYRDPRLQAYSRRCGAALRQLLATYVGRAPGELVFRYSAYGKPLLADEHCHFNVSHSGNRALIAVSSQPIGIDIEAIAMSAHEVEQLTELIFHPLERQAFDETPAAIRAQWFYSIWTMKEAYCKALGTGLQKNLPSIQMTPSHENQSALVIDATAKRGEGYFLHELPAMPGFATSLCLGKPRINLNFAPFMPD